MFSRDRYCQGKPIEHSGQRPMLYSYDDVNKMTLESSRARLISQLVSKPEEFPHSEFASYFHGPSRNNHPSYSVTSHSIPSPIPKKRCIIPTYPSLVGLRWNPYVETSSIDISQTDIVEETKKFTCRCENCSMKHCLSRVSSSSSIKPKIFGDNIMVFSDKYTMTPRLRDAHCGCGIVPPTPRTSDVSVTAYDFVVKDAHDNRHFHQPPIKHNPIPILKKQDEDLIYKYNCHKYEKQIDLHREAERDTDVNCNYQEPIKPTMKSFMKLRRNNVLPEYPPEQYNPRKILYNEGISDVVARQHSMTPARAPSPTNLKKGNSRAPVMSKYFTNTKQCFEPNTIPYSHRSDSRYHYTCKRSDEKHFNNDADEVRHLVASPEIVGRTYTSKPIRHTRVPSIKLPKKVLPSERDIESYIDKSEPKGHVPNRK